MNMHNSNNASVLLSLLVQPQIFTGFINGYRQPVGLARVQMADYSLEKIQPLQNALAYYFTEFTSQLSTIKSTEDILLSLGEIVAALQSAAGLPNFDTVKLAQKDTEFMLWIPTLYEDCYHQAMVFTIKFINYYAAQNQFIAQQNLSDQIRLLINNLKKYAPQGSNSRRLLAAAHQNNIPWMHISQNIFQYGYGCQSRWLDSTFTDSTSQLGTKLARSKICTLSLLRKAGFPVPQQYVVKSEEDAVAKAKMIGYPVVIKPYDQDGGKGVCAHLQSEDRLRKAYQQAKSFSEIVVVERHVFGKDYRLLVLNGELIWAIERMPPSVTGDGVNNIAELIKLLNEQSGRSNEEHATLKCITINKDMTDYLHEQGLGLESIPLTGQVVQLNAVANISTGGVPVGVFDKVHADNKRLIETAASLMRLDIAGVDFIIPDIQESYLQTDAKIIEINSQPQLGTITAPHIYKQLLATLLPNQGRIPIIVLWGGSSHHALISRLRKNLASDYEYIGIARNNIAYLNEDELLHAPSLFAAANSLLLNRQVEVLIYCINHPHELAAQGLPFDRYDYLFFLDSPRSETDFGLLETLFDACVNPIYLLEHTLDYFISLENINDYKMELLLNNPPTTAYPDFINSVNYLNAHSQLITQSKTTLASVPLKIKSYSKIANSVMLSLCLYLQSISDLTG